ncbi:MAG TPA: hypothetical protein V6C76_05815 [Drouetiella sp.]
MFDRRDCMGKALATYSMLLSLSLPLGPATLAASTISSPPTLSEPDDDKHEPEKSLRVNTAEPTPKTVEPESSRKKPSSDASAPATPPNSVAPSAIPTIVAPEPTRNPSGPAFSPAPDAPVIITPQPLPVRERLRQTEQDSLRRIEDLQSQRQQRLMERYQRDLSSAKDAFAQAAKSKEINGNIYFFALINLARSYFNVKDFAKGEPYLKEAINLYLASGDAQNFGAVDTLWQIFPELAHNDFETYFPKMVAAELKRNGSGSNRAAFDRRLATALDRPGRSNLDASDKRRCLMTVIELSSGASGEGAAAMRPWLYRYALLCEADGNITETKKYFDKLLALPADNSNVYVAFEDLRKIRQFYVSHSMSEQVDLVSDKMRDTLMSGARQSSNSVGSMLGQYLNLEPKPDTDSVVASLLSIGGDNVMTVIDPFIHKSVDQEISNGEFAKAEKGLQARIAASSTCRSDMALNDWKISLSEVLLAQNKVDESTRLFEQVRKVVALQDGDVNTLLFNRSRLLTKLGKIEEAKALEAQLPKDFYGKSVSIPYGLFAKHSLTLGNDTTISFYDSSAATDLNAPQSVVGTQSGSGTIVSLNDLTCEGRLHMSGTALYKNGDVTKANANEVSFMQLDDVNLEKSLRHFQSKSRKGKSSESSTTQKGQVKLQASLAPPLRATKIEVSSARHSALSGGDYIATDLSLVNVDASKNVVTRVFLIDPPRPIPNASLNVYPTRDYRPGNFQLWYNGDRPLRIRRASGLIYAPHALVELLPNSDFHGAIVADRIVVSGRNRLSIDTSLLNKVFSSGD